MPGCLPVRELLLRVVMAVPGVAAYAAECTALIKYYDQFDIHDIPGKVKSIGEVRIAYNNGFDIHDVKGTLKSVGDIRVQYYTNFDIHDPKGKVKSVGDVKIKFYNNFDLERLRGRLKSIEGNSDRVEVWTHRGPFRTAE